MKPSKDWVSVVLAVGITLAFNFVTLGVMIDAVKFENATLSDNATQLLTTAFGGIIGVLGGYLGYQAGAKDRADQVNVVTPIPAEDEYYGEPMEYVMPPAVDESGPRSGQMPPTVDESGPRSGQDGAPEQG